MNRLFHAELRKLASTRSLQVAVAGVLAATPVVAVVNTYTAGTNGQAPLTSNAGIHHVLGSGALTGMLMLALGILAMAGEYRHGTVVATFLAEPRRSRVVAAKVVAVGLLGAVVGAVGFGLGLAAAVPALALHGLHHLAGDTVPMLVGITADSALFAVLGVGLGAITRNTVGAIVLSIAWVTVVEGAILQSALPALSRWLPTGTAIALDHTSSDPGKLLQPIPAAALLLAYAAVVAALGARFVARRDAI